MKIKTVVYIIVSCILLIISCKKEKLSIRWQEGLSLSSISQYRKVCYLIKGAQYYIDSAILEKSYIGDSLLQEAIQIAILKDSIPLSYIVYTNALKLTNVQKPELVSSSLMLVNTLQGNQKTDLYLSIIEYYIKSRNISEATKYIERTRNTFEINPEQSIKLLLLSASINNINNLPIDELSDLLEAKNKSILNNQDSLLLFSLNRISDFYFFQKQYYTALSYLEIAKDKILHSSSIIDSVTFMWNKHDIAMVEDLMGQHEKSLTKILLVHQFAIRHNLKRLEDFSEGEIRTNLINSNKLKELATFYTIDYPEKFEELKNTPDLYYRVKAYISESKGDIDSSRIFFQTAALLIENKNNYYIQNFYVRIAEFEERHRDSSLAKNYYLKAYQFAKEDDNIINKISICEILLDRYIPENKEILITQNNAYSKLYELKDADEVRKVELNNILDQKNAEEQHYKSLKNRKSNIQIQIIILFIVFIFTALAIGSNFKWSKLWIRILSYISLITLFELLLYITVYSLDKYTLGEPIKVLGLKVLLIAIITPFHHKIESAVVKFFTKYQVSKLIKEKFVKVKLFFKDLFTKSNEDED